jgi:hypothetical protein
MSRQHYDDEAYLADGPDDPPALSTVLCKPIETPSDELIEMTLLSWIHKKYPLKAKEIIDRLKMRGYSDHDLSEKSLGDLIEYSPRLFLNCLCESISPDNAFSSEVKHDLQNLIFLASETEEKLIERPRAHFIWAGRPKPDNQELLGVFSLHESLPDQKIWFWVLEPHVLHYKNLFTSFSLSNVTVISIENYTKKMDLTFPDGDKLVEIISWYVDFAERILEQSQAEIPRAVRALVTVVDYIKTLIPLYEGGWIFDTNIVFLSKTISERNNYLPSPVFWVFPEGLPQPRVTSFRDVYFIFCNRVFSWDVSKSNYTGCFSNNAPTRGIHHFLYHTLAKRHQNGLSIGKLEILARYYGAAILQTSVMKEYDFVTERILKELGLDALHILETFRAGTHAISLDSQDGAFQYTLMPGLQCFKFSQNSYQTPQKGIVDAILSNYHNAASNPIGRDFFGHTENTARILSYYFHIKHHPQKPRAEDWMLFALETMERDQRSALEETENSDFCEYAKKLELLKLHPRNYHELFQVAIRGDDGECQGVDEPTGTVAAAAATSPPA